MHELLDALQRPPADSSVDLESWLTRYRGRPVRSPMDDATFGGKEAGTFGLAFLSGYQAALRRLVPSLPHAKLVALAATEVGGGHPKAIETVIEDGRLRGQKRYITLGTRADILLVVARRSVSERELTIVMIDTDRPGVTLRALPPTPFVPDVPHAELSLDARLEDARTLAGDGYLEYLKPFRTIEDLHVLLAVLAFAAERARATRAPKELRERITALFAAVESLAREPPLSPATHVALGGVFPMAAEVFDRLTTHLGAVAPAEGRAWSRDLTLLTVAGNVRKKRLERAWEVFG